MKIGEFATACGTKISVLRHYDRLGILKPVYIDRFTDYRYYDKSQIALFNRIAELKSAGFTLSEIRSLLYTKEPQDELFERKRRELEERLCSLERLRQTVSGGTVMNQTYKPLIENTNLPFVDDEQVIGKWQIVGENLPRDIPGSREGFIYFLPKGQSYWGYSWTKGKFIINFPETKYVNDYRVEKRGDDLYMVIDFKSQDYPETGETTPVAFRKLDDRRYTREEIAHRDDVNMPFIPDSRVLGKWRAYCLLRREQKNLFEPGIFPKDEWYYNDLFFKEIEFLDGGHCSTLLGENRTSDDSIRVWTRGYLLNKRNFTACAYEIKAFGEREYLFIEWKSGDYLWGGQEPNYYVFSRA